jgi:hypothetical protein
MNPASLGSCLAQVYWEKPQLWPFVAAGALLVLAGVAWMYPRQLRFVGRPWRWLLPALRTAALLGALVALLRPIAVRPATAAERGVVAVLVDCSRSMSVVDNTRTPAQCVALADALGKLPPGVRGGAVEGLGVDLQQLRHDLGDVQAARDDLDFALLAGREISQRRQHLADVTAVYGQAARAIVARADSIPSDQGLRHAVVALGPVPDVSAADAWKRALPKKLDDAVTALAAFHAAFDRHLYDTNPGVHSICDAIAARSRFELVQQALLDPGSGLLSRLAAQIPIAGYAFADGITPLPVMHDDRPLETLGARPDGAISDLSGGIVAAAGLGRVRAVVLLSDGRQVGGDERAVSGLVPPGVPIFTVGVAAASPPRDLAFSRLAVPAGAFIGDTVTVRAELRHDGFDSGTATVHLIAGDLSEQIHAVDLRPGEPAVADFSLDLKPEQAGALKLTFWIDPIPGEATDLNNRATRWMKVMPERLRVAVFASGPAWDYQELCALLQRRGEIELNDAVLAPGAPPLAMSPREILRQDVVVLCDVPVASISAPQWDALNRLEVERGGSVILVAGPAHLPAEYSSTIAASSLLPFSPSLSPRFRVWPGEQPAFRFIPDPDAPMEDVLKLSNDPALSLRRWQELPPVYRFLQLPTIPEEKLRPGVRALLVEADSGAPVLLERRVGAGRTFFLCTDETWRWRYRVGGRDQERFWRQLIHYAAQEPYFANSDAFSLDADRIAVAPDEPVQVRARIFDASNSPAHELRITRDGTFIGTRPLLPSDAVSSGRFQTTISLPAGNYQLSLGDGPQAVLVPLRVERDDEQELADLSGDDANLRRLAESSGGTFFRIEQITRLPDRLAALTDSRSNYVEMRLWDSPYLFLFIVGCFGMEWALRKHCGLA